MVSEFSSSKKDEMSEISRMRVAEEGCRQKIKDVKARISLGPNDRRNKLLKIVRPP